MKRDVVIRWIKKAESDLRSANVLLKADEKNVRFGKIHDLLTLLEMCIREDKEFEKLDKYRISELTFYKEAFEIAKRVKDFIFKKLNITEKDIL